MSKAVTALLELLDEQADGDVFQLAHLLGQVTADVVTSTPSVEDVKSVVASAQIRQVAGVDEHSNELRLVHGLLVGLFQTLQVSSSSKGGTAGGQRTVKERILFALAEAPAGPTDLGKHVGCATEVASRALRTMREQKLVHRVKSGGPADRRYHLHELTDDGENFVDRRLAGDVATLSDLGEDAPGASVDQTAELRGLIRAVRHISKQDPLVAAELAPTIDRLKGQESDPKLRAEAIGELCVLARSVKDLYGADDMRRWHEELLDMASIDDAISARAYYERGRWRMVYEAPGGNIDGALRDFHRAIEVAENIGGPEKRYRLGWCMYQLALIELHDGKSEPARLKAQKAKEHFVTIEDDGFEAKQGEIASDILIARAHLIEGKGVEGHRFAKRILESTIPVAESNGYTRQVADARLWLGKVEGEENDDNAVIHLSAAARSYAAMGNDDLAVDAKAARSSLRYRRSDQSDAQATVLKVDLEEFSKELSATDRGSYPPAYYWRLATLWRKVGVLASELGQSGSEVTGAFQRALDNSLKSKNRHGQSETLAVWWSFQNPGKKPSHSALRELVIEGGGMEVPAHIIGTAISLLNQEADSGAEAFGNVRRTDLVVHELFDEAQRKSPLLLGEIPHP